MRTKKPLAIYLSLYRESSPLSQREIAHLVGHPACPETVSRHERGLHVPGLETALAYERVYGVPLEELFPGICQVVDQGLRARARVLRVQLRRGRNRPGTQDKLDAVSEILESLGSTTHRRP